MSNKVMDEKRKRRNVKTPDGLAERERGRDRLELDSVVLRAMCMDRWRV